MGNHKSKKKSAKNNKHLSSDSTDSLPEPQIKKHSTSPSISPSTRSKHITKSSKSIKPKFHFIKDNYSTYSELEEGLRKAGLESSNLIVGIDFTASNNWQGGLPYYDNACLHSIDPYPNPYQKVLEIICKSLASFDADDLIPTFGFGDSKTTDRSVWKSVV